MKRKQESAHTRARAVSARRQTSITTFFRSRAAQNTPSVIARSLTNTNASPPLTTSARVTISRPVANNVSTQLRSQPLAVTRAPSWKRRRVLGPHDLADDGVTVPVVPRQSEERMRREVECDWDEDAPLLQAFRTTKKNERSIITYGTLHKKPEVNMMVERAFDFNSLRYDREARKAKQPPLPDTIARKFAKRKLSELAMVRDIGAAKKEWSQTHRWSVDIRDAERRLPSDPKYDPTTLYVPPELLSEGSAKPNALALSPYQKQFWNIKRMNYDVIIFYKKSAFYELYDVDADVCHKELGIPFTKGGRVDMRSCAVSEQDMHQHFARLVQLGYKVGRVEQIETKDAAQKRGHEGKRVGPSKAPLCKRSLVRIVTRGTVTEDALLQDHRPRYVIAIAEQEAETYYCEYPKTSTMQDEGTPSEQALSRRIGVCYVDVAGGRVGIEEYQDELQLSKTERLLTLLRPQEIIVDLSQSSQRLAAIVTWVSRRTEAKIVSSVLTRRPLQAIASSLRAYLKPDVSPEKKQKFQRVVGHFGKHLLCGLAFDAMSWYLKSLLVDGEILSFCDYKLSPSSAETGEDVPGEANQGETSLSLCNSRLSMDAATLQNLEILHSSIDSSERGTLLAYVDRASTPGGRRLIRKWIAEPLVSAVEIEDRLQSIEDIHTLARDGDEVLRSVVTQLRTKTDLERALVKLHKQINVFNSAIMFDDTNNRRVRGFLMVLFDMRSSLQAIDTLRKAMGSSVSKSNRLQWLCTPGSAVPRDIFEKLDYFFRDAFDFSHAKRCGEILPKPGVTPSYDNAKAALGKVESELTEELEKWKSRLGDSTIKFCHRGHESYQIEVKTSTLYGRVPKDFEVVSEDKNVKRFHTPRVKALLKERVEASEACEEASSMVVRNLMQHFDGDYNTWLALSAACAEIDALIGLAFASRGTNSSPMCRPRVLPNGHSEPVFEAEELRHPILAAKSKSFVSNDVMLGGGSNPKIMILTGPNCGGKSTLARQIALAIILAQTGCFVPAKMCCIRPFEDIFVRMGASDDLARGRSTFMVEMEDVSGFLNNANTRSLIIADEVGRGTSTHDGYAVAHATLEHISRVNKSLTVFSTHFCHLGEEMVAFQKMDGAEVAAMFEMAAETKEGSKEIRFLYKLRRGACSSSRGISCARIAGIPLDVIGNADIASKDFDKALSRRLDVTEFLRIMSSLQRGEDEALKEILKLSRSS